jgi:exonuclease SbcC
MLSIQKEKENLERYTNLENLLRETEKASLQIEKLGMDGTELQNRQKEMKAVRLQGSISLSRGNYRNG